MILCVSLLVSSVSVAAISLCYPIPAIIAVGAATVAGRCRRRWQPSDSHGSSRLTRAAEVLQWGLTGKDGLIMGKVGPSPPLSRLEGIKMLCNPAIGSTMACQGFLAAFYNRRWMSERLIRVRGVTHLSTIAPTGKGKGRSCLIPNLRAYPNSCVVFDPKGECFLITALHRRRRLKHKIIVLAPFGMGGRKQSR